MMLLENLYENADGVGVVQETTVVMETASQGGGLTRRDFLHVLPAFVHAVFIPSSVPHFDSHTLNSNSL